MLTVRNPSVVRIASRRGTHAARRSTPSGATDTTRAMMKPKALAILAAVAILVGVLALAVAIPRATTTATATPLARTTPTATASASTTPTATSAPRYTVTAGPTGGGVIGGGQWIAVAGTNGSIMLAQVFTPSGSGPFPAVLVLHGTEGFVQHHAQLAQELAGDGFVGVAACWFGGHYNASVSRRGPPPAFNNPLGIDCPSGPAFDALPGGATWPDAVTNIQALIAAVKTFPNVAPNKIATLGHSRGSIAALTVAASGGGPQATIAADGVPSVSYASREQGTTLLLQGMADTSVSPQTVVAYESAMRSAGKSVQSDYVPDAPHTMLWMPEWHSMLVARAVAFLRAADRK